MGCSSSKGGGGGDVGRRLSETEPTVYEDVMFGCDGDVAGDGSLVETSVQPNEEECKKVALGDAGTIAAFQFQGGLCFLYDATCFSGPRPTHLGRGPLHIIYEVTPSYKKVLEEDAFEAENDLEVETGFLTPGRLFKLLDVNYNQLIDEEEVIALASRFGNAGETGFSFKGAFLTEGDVTKQLEIFNCRAPDGVLDFGEISDALLDTTSSCFETKSYDFYVDGKRDPDPEGVHIKYTRQEMMYGFIGFQPPTCPEYGYPPPPPAMPPLPCAPVKEAEAGVATCGPFEESFAPARGATEVIVKLQVDDYTSCLTECCESTTNEKYGETPCSGVFYTFDTHECNLLKGGFSMWPATSNSGEPQIVLSKLLEDEVGARRVLAAPKEEEEAGTATLEEPWTTTLGNQSFGRKLLEAEPSIHVRSAAIPSAHASPGATLNMGLALAPLVALLVGAVLGRSRFARRAANKTDSALVADSTEN